MTRCWSYLPTRCSSRRGKHPLPPGPVDGEYVSFAPDQVRTLREEAVGYEGMRIDRKYFEKFEDRILRDEALKAKVQSGNWHEIETYMEEKHYNQPLEYFTREKLRLALHADRTLEHPRRAGIHLQENTLYKEPPGAAGR